MAESRSVYRRLMEQGKQRWIPISEMEPGAEHVLVTLRWDADDLEVAELDYWAEKDASERFDVARRTLEHITAWMPLPEPYKGEQT